MVRIGTAGWSIPWALAGSLPGSGAHLVRYGRVMPCAEINSTFYRPPRASTYARWAESTPESFRFSVKVPKTITHECSLAPAREQITSFLDSLEPLGCKLGPLLLQLPPRQGFAEGPACAFLGLLRECFPHGPVVLEPRHPAWFTAAAARLLSEFKVNMVLADPPPQQGLAPDATGSLVYYRLHGAPRVYYSSYSDDYLDSLRERLKAAEDNGAAEVWCIFDNTASGAALANALALQQSLATHGLLPPGAPQTGGAAVEEGAAGALRV